LEPMKRKLGFKVWVFKCNLCRYSVEVFNTLAKKFKINLVDTE
jgi:hypothetical protein